jgi:hypothetical protein
VSSAKFCAPDDGSVEIFQQCAYNPGNMKQILALVLFGFVGCATLQPGAERVKIVDARELQRLQEANCQQVGEVNSGGQDFSNQAMIVVRNQALKLRANVVLSSGVQTSNMVISGSSISGHNLKGIAFDCGPEIYNRLLDLSKI